MIVAALSMLAPAAAPPPPDTAEQQIVVIGEKLKGWRGAAKKRDGKWVCETKRSTGDLAIDRIGCDAMISCFGGLEAEWLAIGGEPDKKLRKARLGAFYKEKMTPCVFERRSDGIAELAAQRAGL